MAKLVGISRDTLANAIAAENLDENVTVKIGDEIVKEPGVMGIGKTKNGNFMVYSVNDEKKLFNTSVHEDEELANGMLLRRLRVKAADDVQETAETETQEEAVA